jgi:hypothetical protein
MRADSCSNMFLGYLTRIQLLQSELTNRRRIETQHRTKLKRRMRKPMMLKKDCRDHRGMRIYKAATNHRRHNSSWGFEVMKSTFDN